MAAALISMLFESPPSIDAHAIHLVWRKVCDKNAVVNDFGACDLVIGVRIDVRSCSFLIGNLNDVKLIAQSVINEWQRRSQA